MSTRIEELIPYYDLGSDYESEANLPHLQLASDYLGSVTKPYLRRVHASILSEGADIYLLPQINDTESAIVIQNQLSGCLMNQIGS